MANENKQFVNMTAEVSGHNVDFDPFPDAHKRNDTPEDVVRKLLETESYGGDAPRPHPRPRTRVSPASGGASDKVPTGPSIVGRLSAVPRRAVRKAWTRARAAALSYRPAPRHMALALLVVIVVIMPWLIPILFLLGLTGLVVTYLSLGHDRSAELIAGRYGRLARRDPQGAELLRSRAEWVSARLSGWLGYLPERWTAGLYLPDFVHPDEVPEKLSDDPFKRLAEESENR